MEPLLDALRPRLEAWLRDTRGELVEDLMALARIPSVAGPPEENAPYGAACAQVLEQGMAIARRRGFCPQNHENHCVTLLLPGRTNRVLGLFCHLDVVPQGTGWSFDPFRPFVRDGHVFGRGVTDNKGPAVAMLSLLQFMMREKVTLEHSILLYLGACEEAGMRDLDWYLKRYQPPERSLTPDAQFPVCYGEKGQLTAVVCLPLPCGSALRTLEGGQAANAVPDTASALLEGLDPAGIQPLEAAGLETVRTHKGVRVSCAGVSAHAALPETGQHAVVKLCRALMQSGVLDTAGRAVLERYLSLFSDCHGSGLGVACSDQPSGKLTAVAGRLRTQGGQLVQTLDLRYPVTAEGESLRLRLEEAVGRQGGTVKQVEIYPPHYIPIQHPLIQLLKDTCNQVLGAGLAPYTLGGGTYARRLPMAAAFGHLLRCRPRPGGCARGGGHQADECVSIQGLEDLIRVYLPALLRLDQAELPPVCRGKEEL